MSLVTPGVRVLFGKELRQLVRNRQAVLAAAVLPLLLLGLVPAVQVYAFTHVRAGGGGQPGPAAQGIAGLSGAGVVALYLLPLFVSLAGVLAPAVTAVATIVVERERRTVELLVALPVTVAEILTAKLAATMAAIALVTVPLTLVDGAVAVTVLHQPPLYVPLLLLLLAGALASSSCLSAVLAILARDYRTAQQLSGLLVFPLLLVVNLVLLVVPGLARLPALAGVLTLLGALAAWLAVRRFTFERYLS